MGLLKLNYDQSNFHLQYPSKHGKIYPQFSPGICADIEHAEGTAFVYTMTVAMHHWLWIRILNGFGLQKNKDRWLEIVASNLNVLMTWCIWGLALSILKHGANTLYRKPFLSDRDRS